MAFLLNNDVTLELCSSFRNCLKVCCKFILNIRAEHLLESGLAGSGSIVPVEETGTPDPDPPGTSRKHDSL